MTQSFNSPPKTEADVLRRTLGLVRERLAVSWELNIDELDGEARADALLRLQAPDGSLATLVVEAKRLVEARDLPRILDQVSSLSETVGAGQMEGAGATQSTVAPLIVARYLSPRTRERLEELDTNYADATGNLWIALDRPALFLRDIGAQRDPWRDPDRPRESFRGPPAGRVVRALADFAPPMSVPELIDRSGASTGAAYRMVDLLESEAYIQRDERGPITMVRWRPMLERWGKDYEFARTNPTATLLEPRGLPALEERLQGANFRYAITGSMAAERYARYAPARLAMVYVDGIDRAAEELELRQVDSGGNVVLATPTRNGFVYERSNRIDGLNFAAPSQAAVDLLRSPGRGPAEAVALLDWMEENEGAWRL